MIEWITTIVFHYTYIHSMAIIITITLRVEIFDFVHLCKMKGKTFKYVGRLLYAVDCGHDG